METTIPRATTSYVVALLCEPIRANCVRLARWANISHDSLTRVLNHKTVEWNVVFKSFIQRAFGGLQDGYLIIDDTTINKQFAKMIEGISWVRDGKLGKIIRGYSLVVLAWSDGDITIPLALRIYQKSDDKKDQVTKTDLAVGLLMFAKNVLKIKPIFVLFDIFYSSHKVLSTIESYGWYYISQVKKNRHCNGKRVDTYQRTPYWTTRGTLNGGHTATVVKHRKKYFITNDMTLDGRTLRELYRFRWSIEECFKVLHDQLGLDGCESRSFVSQHAHVYLSMIAYCVGACEKTHNTHLTHYAIKDRCIRDALYAKSLVESTFLWDA